MFPKTIVFHSYSTLIALPLFHRFANCVYLMSCFRYEITIQIAKHNDIELSK